MRQGRKVVRPQIDDDQIGTVRRRREIPRRFRRLVERIGDAVGHRILRSGVLIAVIACRAASRMGDQRIVGAEITGDDAGIRLVAVLGLRFERLVLRKPLGPVTAGQRIADKFDMPSGRGRRRQQTPSPVKQEGMDRRAPLLAFRAFLHPHGMFAAPQLLGQHHDRIRPERCNDAGVAAVDGQIVVILFRIRNAHRQRAARKTTLETGSAPVETHVAAVCLRTSDIAHLGRRGGRLCPLLGGNGAGAQQRQHRKNQPSVHCFASAS